MFGNRDNYGTITYIDASGKEITEYFDYVYHDRLDGNPQEFILLKKTVDYGTSSSNSATTTWDSTENKTVETVVKNEAPKISFNYNYELDDSGTADLIFTIDGTKYNSDSATVKNNEDGSTTYVIKATDPKISYYVTQNSDGTFKIKKNELTNDFITQDNGGIGNCGVVNLGGENYLFMGGGGTSYLVVDDGNGNFAKLHIAGTADTDDNALKINVLFGNVKGYKHCKVLSLIHI